MLSKFNANKIGLIVVVALSLVATTAYAIHSWGNYHWARKANPFTLKLGDNVSTAWDSYLLGASADWSVSSVLDTTVVAGNAGSPKRCRATNGRVEVCNASYGNNGWLGVASIWVSGSHIAKGVVKVNDTYFNTSAYNTTGWRSLVACQEIGHTLGLGHQDEDFNNTPITPHTCMDYFAPNASEVVHPNQHDYDQLETIYNGHLDSITTVGQTITGQGNHNSDIDMAEWGKSVKKDGNGRDSLYERDLGNGQKIFTFVFWSK